MKTAVTGGAGFIGSNLVGLLLGEGHQVTVLDDLSSGYGSNLSPYPAVNFIQGDVRNPEDVDRALEGTEVVFHLTASVGNSRSIANPLLDSEINVLGTLQILQGALKHGVRKIVYSSSAGIFGELKTLPIKEDHPIEPDSPYGASKLAAEKLCLVYSKLYAELECVCLRYFNVYGINQRYDAYGNVIPIFAHRLVKKQPVIIYGDGEQTRDFVNVWDVAQANYQAGMAAGISGAYNIASGTRITINRLYELMRDFYGEDSRVEYQAPRQGDVLHSLADITLAQTAFSYNPSVSLEAGLEEYLNWYKAAVQEEN